MINEKIKELRILLRKNEQIFDGKNTKSNTIKLKSCEIYHTRENGLYMCVMTDYLDIDLHDGQTSLTFKDGYITEPDLMPILETFDEEITNFINYKKK